MDNKSWYIVLNPTAGSGKALRKKSDIINAFKKVGMSFEIAITQYVGHAETLVREAIQNGYKQFLAVGGDGTNNEVVNGMLTQKSVSPGELCFAALPLGTGNDWARYHNIGQKDERILKLIAQQKVQTQDVGVAEYFSGGEKRKRYFINVAGMAFDAFVVQSLAQKRSKYLSKFIYMVEILRSLQKYEGADLELLVNGKSIYKRRAYTVNVGICKYSGGGMQVTPHANSKDGMLAWTVIDFIPKWKIVRSFHRLLMGTILSHPAAHHAYAREIEIHSISGQFGIELDGEYAGEGPVSLSIIPNALKFIAP